MHYRQPKGKTVVSKVAVKDSATITSIIELAHKAKWEGRGSPNVVLLGNMLRRAKRFGDVRSFVMDFSSNAPDARLLTISFETYQKSYSI